MNTIDTCGMDTLLFDLDATLAPYIQDELTDAFFGDLHRFAVESHSCDGDSFDRAARAALRAMKKNDGSVLNRERFRPAFAASYPDFHYDAESLYEEFYTGPFSAVRRVVRYRGTEQAMLRSLREKGYRLVCATNPVFPASANRQRMEWAGIAPEDFDFVTLNDNCHWCKPAAAYFLEAAAAVGARPEQCLMVGNDTQDDLGALDAGMQALLITDYLKVRGDRPYEDVCAMTYDEFLRFAEALPPVRSSF